MAEGGIEVDHTTLYRWVQHYAPLMEKRLKYFWFCRKFIEDVVDFH